MLLHLIKKDILIVKKHVLMTMLIIIAIPLFVMFTAHNIPGLIPFVYMIVLGEVLLLQAIAQEEAKHPKTIALLCATPYQRKTFVLAKYMLFFLIFIYCSVVYTLIAFFINKTIIINLTTFLVVMMIGAIVFSIYMPIEFKYGVVKAKFIFMIIILLFSLAPPLFVNLFGSISIKFSILKTLSPLLKNTVLALGNVFVLGVSLIISTKIFAKKEL